jgi:hypothetical protein
VVFVAIGFLDTALATEDKSMILPSSPRDWGREKAAQERIVLT